MQAPPQWVIDAWPKPNFVNPVTQGNAKITVNLVLYPIALILVLLRTYTRLFHLKVNTFSTDDFLILLAMIPATAFFILSLLADLHFLWRRHVYDIPVSNIETGLKLVLTIELVFALSCTLCKLSVLFLIRRVLASATLLWRRLTLAAIWIIAIQGIIFETAIIFQCRPPQHYWKVVYHPQPECVNETSILLIAGIINTLTDFLVVLLPIKTVLNLKLPKRQTWIILALFGLGILSGVAGVVRTYYTYEVTTAHDSTWLSFPVWITAAVELYIGLICASIPATKPFFSTYIPRLFHANSVYASRSQPPRSPYQLRLSQLREKHFSINSASSSSPPSPTTPERVYTLCSLSFKHTTKVRGDRDMHISLSSIISNKNEAMRRELEDEHIFQYGPASPVAFTPLQVQTRNDSSNNSEADGVGLDKISFTNECAYDEGEDMVIQGGRSTHRDSLRSQEGCDNRKHVTLPAECAKVGHNHHNHRKQMSFVLGGERAFRSVNGSSFKDFDLERGLP